MVQLTIRGYEENPHGWKLHFIDDPGKSIEGTIQAIKHPIETYDYLSQSIAASFERDVINGDAESRAKWISYALGNIVLSAVGTKGLGAVSKTVKATTKVGVHKVKDAAEKIPILNLYPYVPQHQLVGVNAGGVPYNTVNSVGLRDQLISMAKVEARGSGKGTDNTLDGVRIINKKYGGEVYKLSSDLGQKYPEGVKFSKEGFPDFGPYSKAKLEIDGLIGDHYYDFKKANEVLGLKNTPAGYTWHHVEDGRTMMLVPSDIHGAVRHTGGASLINKGLKP